ncbi:hypothetical protein DY000_02024018 [Brassica cretica]|uniref:Uncharacterized protein n=1 Tax=Brassica cretica TaxID=69181 RepID=A0ABQ7E451_BRACR|nr:hypothetical protein DY000_02024018 [Brassica cretica]
MVKKIGRYDQFPKTGQTSSTLALFERSGVHIKPTSRMATRRPSKSFRCIPKHPRKHHATLDQADPNQTKRSSLHQLAKPTSFKGSLQPIQLGSTQSYLWEPGYHLNHTEYIIHGQEEFFKFIPCTSQHRIMRIPINSNLPYLELLAFKLQQLFFLDLCTTSAHSKPSRRFTTFIPFRFTTFIPFISPTRSSLWSIHQVSIIHLAHPDSQPATFGIRAQAPVSEARKFVAQEGQGVLPQQDYFKPNQGHTIVHCLDQKSDIPEAM